MSCQPFEADVIDLARGAGAAEAARQHLLACPRCAARFDRERQLSERLQALADATPAPTSTQAMEDVLAAAFREHHRASGRGGRAWFGWPVRFAAAAALVLAVAGWLTVGSLRDESGKNAPAVGAGGRPAIGGAPQAPVAKAAPAAEPAAVEASKTAAAPVRTARAGAPRPAVVRPAPPADADVTEFIALPLAAGLPRFESGRIVRIELPVTSLPALGLDVLPDASRRPIEADVLVGQDGQARAIRLVSTDSGSRRIRR